EADEEERHADDPRRRRVDQQHQEQSDDERGGGDRQLVVLHPALSSSVGAPGIGCTGPPSRPSSLSRKSTYRAGTMISSATTTPITTKVRVGVPAAASSKVSSPGRKSGRCASAQPAM